MRQRSVAPMTYDEVLQRLFVGRVFINQLDQLLVHYVGKTVMQQPVCLIRSTVIVFLEANSQPTPRYRGPNLRLVTRFTIDTESKHQKQMSKPYIKSRIGQLPIYP